MHYKACGYECIMSEEEVQDICNYKEENQDKTTNQLLGEPRHSEFYENPFETSPLRQHLFFTSNSPNPMVHDIHHPHQDTKRNGHVNSRSVDDVCGIKLEFEEEMELKMEKIEEVFEKDSDGILRRQRKPNRSAKNFKGLKNLSENVYQIVSELGGTTYKEVAEKLISKLHGRVRKDMGYEGSKDQHNIKRRVYDALNVLIATGLLHKQGKRVFCMYPFSKNGQKIQICNEQLAEEKECLDRQLQQRYESVQGKMLELAKMEEKKRILSCIIGRNQQKEFLNGKRLQFPLIATLSLENTAIRCRVKGNIMVLDYSEGFEILGDIDLLMKISRQNVEVNNLLGGICCKIDEQTDVTMQR